MRKKSELYLIGERVKRFKIIILIILGVVTGIIMGFIFESVMIGSIISIIFGFVFIIITRRYYWIICSSGIYTPLNFGIIKYILVTLKYIFVGNDTSELVFVNYRMISALNLLLKSSGLGLQIIKKDEKMIFMLVKKELFNQDLINSIKYIKRKGIDIKNYEIINKINMENNGQLKIKKN